MRKDKKLLLAAVLLPVTLLFLGAAVAASLPAARAAEGVPTAHAAEGQTCVGIATQVELHADDPEDDIVLYQLTEQPRLGTASIEGSVLTYTPGDKAGTDGFSYTVVDADGNTAQPAAVTITVDKNRAGLTYADMDGNPAHYAALCLAEQGIMTGECIGGVYFFHPAQTVTRSEFIAMAAAAAELPVQPTARTDFADDSGLSPWAKPFISTAAASGLVTGYPTAGGLSEIRGQNPITLAEASVVVGNLLDTELDGTQYALAAQHDTDPDWAQAAVSSLERMELLSPLTAMQQPDEPLTRAGACDMLYRAMQLMQA